jgi:hypothetical protein
MLFDLPHGGAQILPATYIGWADPGGICMITSLRAANRTTLPDLLRVLQEMTGTWIYVKDQSPSLLRGDANRENLLFSARQTGQRQSVGRSSNAVPGGVFALPVFGS